MKLRQLALALAVGVWAFGPPAPAAAQKRDDPSVVTLQVCNNTENNARVALTYQPVGANAFYNQGWYGVPAHTCQNLVDTDNGYFYGYAEVENDGDRYWSGDNGQCVAFPGPFAFWSNNARHCDDGQEVRNFVAMHTNNFGVFTWNLNPQ